MTETRSTKQVPSKWLSHSSIENTILPCHSVSKLTKPIVTWIQSHKEGVYPARASLNEGKKNKKGEALPVQLSLENT